MGKLILVWPTSFLQELSVRPDGGAGKFGTQKNAKPRIQLSRILKRISRDINEHRSVEYLRADVLEEPLHVRRNFHPDSFGVLISNRDKLARLPEESDYHSDHPNSYLVTFAFPKVGWACLCCYLEMGRQSYLVFLRVAEMGEISWQYDQLVCDLSIFEEHLSEALREAELSS